MKTIEEEDILSAQNGDQESVNLILGNYKKFIFFNSKKYFLVGADKDDLLQEGMIGLIKAIHSYDNTKKTTFKTFATICIKRHLITVIKATNTQKNKILNLASENSLETGEGKEIYFRKGLATQSFLNPEELYLAKEKVKELVEYGEKNFSKFEKHIFELIIQGYEYREISIIVSKNLKTIDNTIQRIKKKSEKWRLKS